VRAIIDMLWEVIDLPASHAIHNLRLALPRQVRDLERSHPKTQAAIAGWDAQWTASCKQAFDGLPVDPDKLRRMVALLPGAMMGLRTEEHLVTFVDIDEARPHRGGHRLPRLSAASTGQRFSDQRFAVAIVSSTMELSRAPLGQPA
jgi:hypothetical protein